MVRRARQYLPCTLFYRELVVFQIMIEDEIPDGAAGITDNFTLQQANAIVAALKSGVLPVELRKLS
jgi:preprotein translocase subunit SecD